MSQSEATLKFEPLLVREEGPVLIVTINRPEALNALNEAVLTALDSVLSWLGTDKARHLRAVILTGAGEKAFVAGADIKQFEDFHPRDATAFARRGQELFTRLERMNIPVIAAVNGFALGGGLELALACDFIYASENAKFGLPECTLGIMPGYGGTVRLPRRVGPARARELAFSGAMLTAEEAAKMGLVNRVLPQMQLLATTLETAMNIVNRAAPVAVGAIKESIHQGMQLSEEKAHELEARLFGDLFATEDAREGTRAFVEKRKPKFQGK